MKNETMLIKDFFKNQEIFITGGTGYLGKSLIEKLLRECPDISKMYLLIRSKRNKTPLERLKEFSEDLVFERLHREQPNAFEKIIPIVGDSVELGLGISQEDLERLKNVTIIVHGAANVRFDNNLRGSILMNTRGTHELLKIALNLKHLIAFIHVSTAYVNPFAVHIKEQLYKAPVEWRSALKVAETYDEETLEILKLKYTKYYPNAYSFTKNLSEQVVAEFSDRLPITILRPSIVSHSMKDPESGFIDNLNGPMGMLVAIAMGISQVTYCNPDLIMALINVDIVTDFTIIAIYRRGLESMNSKKIGLDIRNISAGTRYKYTLNQSTKIFLNETSQEPFVKSLWAPTCFMTTNYFLFIMCVFLVNIPLALIYDFLLMLSKEEKMVLKLTRKVVYTSKALEKFSQKYFEIQNDGMWELLKLLPEKEIKTFGNITEAFEKDYIQTMRELRDGVKKYIFREPLKATPATQRRFKIFIILDRIIKLLICSMFVVLLWKLVN
ncbi:putative fatty acyl-CoA reductase [Lucilia cuprina]|uniref:Fatty acyl-CoA reductase n=1 Tax=Lucilia cuprina TaxID=7375 RepID=A0A0L0BTW8_LUCCU|nr:putative fatty acyl-CoA reductase [Lucilia cuprina]